MRCSEVIEHLEAAVPAAMAEDWDNVGLLAGRMDREVDTIYLAVDATDEVVEDAIECGAQMLITHHPLIFKALKKVNDQDFISRRIVRLLQADISYYAMHTNFDVMGMADAAADELLLEDREVLDLTYEDEISKEGIGRIGRLPQEMTLHGCAVFVREHFHLDGVRMYGDPDRVVRRAAVCPGSGKSVIGDAIRLGADVLITGDIDHHEGIDAVAQGLSIIDAGHYGLEKIFVPYMRDFLKRDLAGMDVICAAEKNPFQLV